MADVINKRYEIKKQLGEGGMGKTYLALDQKSGKQVVVKLLCLKSVNEWKAVELFEREARTLKNINHPFIPDYLDYFTRNKNGDTEYYLVQEYIEGDNLAGQVKDGRRFTEEQVFEIAEKLLSILAYLQALRPPVVHRDINPKNIIVDHKNEVYLVDFGAARGAITGAGSDGTTVVGTYGYMPMEQLMGRASPASDLYALGMTLIYLLSHTEPQDFPLKNMKIMYKKFVSVSLRYLSFLDRLVEPDTAKRLPDAKSALSLLARLKRGAALDSGGYSAVIDLHNLLPPFKSKIRFQCADEMCTVTIPAKIIKSLPLGIFSVFWFSFIALWTMLVFQIPGVFSVFFGLFSIPFWLVGFFLIGKTINGFSTASVKLTPESVHIKRGVLRPTVTIPLDQVQKIGIKEVRTNPQARNTGLGQSVSYGIELEAGAKTILIDKFLTHNEAQWVAQVAEKYKELYS